jgi:hypothetical protein
MADSSSSPGDGGDTAAEPPRSSSAAYPGTPRWVKVSGIVVLAILVLLVVAAIATGGQHGPRRHMPSGAPVGPAISGGPPAALQAQQHDRA